MLACLSMGQWVETSANAPTMLQKWVCCHYSFDKFQLHDLHSLCTEYVVQIFSESFFFLCLFVPSLTAASGGTAYFCQLAMAVLRHPTGQVLFATWVAALAGLAAWYLM